MKRILLWYIQFIWFVWQIICVNGSMSGQEMKLWQSRLPWPMRLYLQLSPPVLDEIGQTYDPSLIKQEEKKIPENAQRIFISWKHIASQWWGEVRGKVAQVGQQLVSRIKKDKSLIVQIAKPVGGAVVGWMIVRRVMRWWKQVAHEELLLDHQDREVRIYGCRRHQMNWSLVQLLHRASQSMPTIFSELSALLVTGLRRQCSLHHLKDYISTVDMDLRKIFQRTQSSQFIHHLEQVMMINNNGRNESITEVDRAQQLVAFQTLGCAAAMLRSQQSDAILRQTRSELLSAVVQCEDLIKYYHHVADELPKREQLSPLSSIQSQWICLQSKLKSVWKRVSTSRRSELMAKLQRINAEAAQSQASIHLTEQEELLSTIDKLTVLESIQQDLYVHIGRIQNHLLRLDEIFNSDETLSTHDVLQLSYSLMAYNDIISSQPSPGLLKRMARMNEELYDWFQAAQNLSLQALNFMSQDAKGSPQISSNDTINQALPHTMPTAQLGVHNSIPVTEQRIPSGAPTEQPYLTPMNQRTTHNMTTLELLHLFIVLNNLTASSTQAMNESSTVYLITSQQNWKLPYSLDHIMRATILSPIVFLMALEDMEDVVQEVVITTWKTINNNMSMASSPLSDQDISTQCYRHKNISAINITTNQPSQGNNTESDYTLVYSTGGGSKVAPNLTDIDTSQDSTTSDSSMKILLTLKSQSLGLIEELLPSDLLLQFVVFSTESLADDGRNVSDVKISALASAQSKFLLCLLKPWLQTHAQHFITSWHNLARLLIREEKLHKDDAQVRGNTHLHNWREALKRAIKMQLPPHSLSGRSPSSGRYGSTFSAQQARKDLGPQTTKSSSEKAEEAESLQDDALDVSLQSPSSSIIVNDQRHIDVPSELVRVFSHQPRVRFATWLHDQDLVPRKRLSLIRWADRSVRVGFLLIAAAMLSLEANYRSRDIAKGLVFVLISVRGFLDRRVVAPLRGIINDVIFNQRMKIADPVALNDTKATLQTMVLDYLDKYKSKHKKLSDEQRRELAKNMDLSVLSEDFAQELKRPLPTLISGPVARILLIQLQFFKRELLIAMQALDDLLNANQVNVQLLALIPALFIVYMGQRVASSALYSLFTLSRGRELQSVAQVHSHFRSQLRALERSLSFHQDDAKESSDRFMGEMMTRLYRMQGLLTHDATRFPDKLRKQLQEDLCDLSSFVNLKPNQRLIIIERMIRSYPFLQPHVNERDNPIMMRWKKAF